MFNETNIWHVIPLNDLEEHSFRECKCEPRIERYDSGMTIIHNSFDGREALELANLGEQRRC